MIRWVLVVALAMLCINGLNPLLRKLGLGRLPGDFQFRWHGRDYHLPLATTLLLSVVLSLLVRVLSRWL